MPAMAAKAYDSELKRAAELPLTCGTTDTVELGITPEPDGAGAGVVPL